MTRRAWFLNLDADVELGHLHGYTPGRRIQHYVDRDISDVLRRLDRYSSAKAADLLDAGEIGTLPGNLRRFVSRFFKCLVSRKGYREGGWGLLIALCAGLYPLLAHLKARLEPERHRPGGGS